MTQKNNGVYYTPELLTSYIVQHSLKNLSKKKELSLLEPSCGDGVFIEAISEGLAPNEKKLLSIECVEIDKTALDIAKSRACSNFKSRKFLNQNFFEFLNGKKKKYDYILGNPPYVVRKRLDEEASKECKNVYHEAGLNDKYFRNLWGAFLIGSIRLLSDDGILSYVLPAELLQVKFSEELRNFLIESFDRIEIVSFREIVFEDIQQDTVVLFGYKKHCDKGLFFSQRRNIKDLIKNEPKFIRKDIKANQNIKWTSHVLTQKELALLLRFQKRFKPISNYCKAVAGIVTAANNYFIVDESTLKKYDLEEFALPIIQRGIFISGSVVFTKDSLNELKTKGKACNLLSIQNSSRSALSGKTQSYLDLGEDRKIDQRHKCQKRPVWYSVPGIWKSEGFFFKRCHLYPKILVNEADAMVTDSAYRITMLNGECVDSLVYSFYNSLTLALAELGGRFYGGGVLELTPNEFKSISIPYVSIDKERSSIFFNRFENKDTIEDLLKMSDHEILTIEYGISASDVEKIQKIKKKLTERRLDKDKM